jgi:pilus assembly protein CpaB
MRTSVVVMLVLAAVFGLIAVFAGQKWLSHQATLQKQNLSPVTIAAPSVPVATIVVAAQALRYGDELSASQLREMPWPAGDMPKGAFKTRDELMQGKERRVVLAPMEPNELVLDSKITGPGQRSTLSALMEEGMGAVTVQVNEVVGVAGFVLPGERVDVLMTRYESGGDGGPQGAGAMTAAQNSYSDVVLRNIRVLAVGQMADEKNSKPSVVNAVTIEVSPVDAQKVALASRAGSLSLMLRKAGDASDLAPRRVALTDIGQSSGPSALAVINVARGVEVKQYSVRAHPSVAPPIPVTSQTVSQAVGRRRM